MDVHALGWLALAAIILTMIAVDIVGHVRTPHEPTVREAAWWSAGYIAVAVVFGAIVAAVWGADYGEEYFAGYITEKSLSIDNLFVFVIMISSFRVPRRYQQEVLLAGIVIALVLRLVFILAGAALIESFSWVFYLFGAWLLWTAVAQAREGIEKPEEPDADGYRLSGLVKLVSRIVPMTDGFVGGRLLHRHAGRTMITPLLLCIIAIGTADVVFAVDSIPAIYSLTAEPYLVFAANAFSLLGLRQLYFLIDGLLDRLVYLHYGLAAILGFIGLKLVNHALHTNEVPFINGGQPWDAVTEPSIGVSLGYIVVVVIITVAASVLASRRARDASRPARVPESTDA
ncbi:TerC family protein [Actinomyces israelii]|uniref:TerC family protein n=1 Tax=Actinomyces israelii TaxID=1659 RepID=UPI002552F4B3|nr:TerC family protein [Actinomyces israelii]WKR21846.1 putative membrane protein [Actinomyces israelii]